MRMPAEKFAVLNGLSPAAYTLFQTLDVLVAIFGPLEVPTVASADLGMENNATMSGATTRAKTTRAVVD